jgi:hypothetical protein
MANPKKQRATALDREEQALARRAAAGDRAAFDALYDRYFARMAWQFRELPESEAQLAIGRTLEQLFAQLGTDGDGPLAERAFLLARAARRPRSAPTPPAPSRSSHPTLRR